MDFKKVLGVGVVVIFGGVVYFLFFAKATVTKVSEPVASVAPALPLPDLKERNKKLSQIFQAPRTLPGLGETVTPECKQVFSEIENYDLARMGTAEGSAPPEAKACKTVPAVLNKKYAEFIRACQPLRDQPDYKKDSDKGKLAADCTLGLFNLRAMISDYATKDIPLDQITDLKTLTDKLAAQIEENPQASAEIAERILSLDPEMYPAAKAAMASYLQLALANSGPEMWGKFRKSLDRTTNMQKGEDARQLMEMDLAADIGEKQDPQAVRAKAEKISQEHPELGTGPYNVAWSLLNTNDREGAIAMLGEALRREPQNEIYRDTLARAKAGEKKPFSLVIGTTFNPSQYMN